MTKFNINLSKARLFKSKTPRYEVRINTYELKSETEYWAGIYDVIDDTHITLYSLGGYKTGEEAVSASRVPAKLSNKISELNWCITKLYRIILILILVIGYLIWRAF